MNIKTKINDLNLKGQRKLAFSALFILAVLLLVGSYIWSSQTVLRIRDWQDDTILLQVPANPGDQLYFSWLHSVENTPWHEYYYIAANLNLVLETIAFASFGAGMPENRGQSVRIQNGLIVMEGIGEPFSQIVWLNSPYYTQEIRLNQQYLTHGSELPTRRLILRIERRGFRV